MFRLVAMQLECVHKLKFSLPIGTDKIMYQLVKPLFEDNSVTPWIVDALSIGDRAYPTSDTTMDYFELV